MRRVWAAALGLALLLGAGCSAGGNPATGNAAGQPSAPRSPAASPTSRLVPSTSHFPRASPTTSRPRAAPSAPPRLPSQSASAARHAVRHPLPLGYRTASARQVITVVAPGPASTTATLQAWRRSQSGWRSVGPSVPAWLGYAGFSESAAEDRTATPTGSYTLTRAFGADPNPGTKLPYLRTTGADWWISQPGPLYNTLQHCWSDCGFAQGAPNEHLHDELPHYDYAVVIDYNTRNAPGGVRQGAGSAFFLHVTVHQPTQGCVSIPKGQLVRLLRWLRPRDHPRILLGVQRDR